MYMPKSWTLAFWVGAALAAIGLMTLWSAGPSAAADLGGNCCADLEERIAELESTTARKGNKKVSLTVAGQVNAGLLYVDIEDYSNTTVINNGNDENFVSFAGSARVNADISAGYVLKLEARDLGILGEPAGSFTPRVQQSYWFLKSEALGRVSVGKGAVATHGFDEITTANTAVANKPLSLGALSDAYLTGIDVPFDGGYSNIVRYDSPALSGFTASASWGPSFDATSSDGNGDTYDVALRYAGDIQGFKMAGGLGYRKSTDFEVTILNTNTIYIPTGDVTTFLVSGSIMHTGTGLFITGNYADQDWDDAGFKLKGYAATGGIERKWFSVGATTLYGEWNKFELKDGGGSGSIDMYGLGAVQALDAAAMDLYVSYRRYDLGDLGADDLTAVTAGARIKF